MAAARRRSAGRWRAPACAPSSSPWRRRARSSAPSSAPIPVIYILGGYARETVARYAAHDLRPVLNSAEQARTWAADRPGAPAAVQIDTGMNRLGMEAVEFAGLGPLPDAVVLVMSHLGCADEPGHPLNEAQLAEFRRLTDGLGRPRSLSATAGLLLGPDWHFQMTRPGIGLYGGWPFAQARPVVRLEAPIIQIRDLAPGERVGYAASWTAGRPSRIATIGLGYADGVDPRRRAARHGQDRRPRGAVRRTGLDGPDHARRDGGAVRAGRHGRAAGAASGDRRAGRHGRHDRPRGADLARRPLSPGLSRRLTAGARSPWLAAKPSGRAMRIPLLCCLAVLGACTGQPGPIDWQDWLTAERAVGRMRDDPAPLDAPFDNPTLARNFRTIAFDVERDPFATGEARGASGEARLLRRWKGPVRWAVYAAPAEQVRVQSLVGGLAARLAGLTGLDFHPAGAASGLPAAPPNLQVWLVPGPDRGAARLLPARRAGDA